MGTLLPQADWNVEVLPLALRTTAQQVDLIKPVGANGVYVTVNWTLEADTVTLTPTISMQPNPDDPTPVFVGLLVGTALTGTGVTTYLVDRGAAAAAEGVTESISYSLPRMWRFSMAVGDADAATYSVWAAYVY